MRLTTPRWLPRFTIERLRTVVLVGGVLLVAGIAIFLAAGQWKLHKLVKDLPKRLGIDIEQQADGVNYTQSRKGKTLFKIHAARAVQMKQAGKTLLHDVRIDLYGEDGQRTDTISGSEFEYDPRAGLAQAAGAVEITLMRPGVRPAVAQLKPGSAKPGSSPKPDLGAKPDLGPKHGAAGGAGLVSSAITDNEIHVKTSGLLFDQKSGVASTKQRVDFALRQGSGNSIGATYDSAKGELILDHAVELHADRDNAQDVSEPVTVHASHAEFERNEQACRLTQAVAEYTGGEAQTGDALIHFREDGSVLRLDGSDGVDLKTRSGGHVTAPRGTLDFDENNHPRRGLLTGGAKMEMNQPGREIRGSSPTARLAFDGEGQLSQAHLEQGVLFTTRQQVTNAKGSGELSRTWKSQSADIAFAATEAGSTRNAAQQRNEKSVHRSIEPRTIHGFGGVTITSEARENGVVTPSKLSADTVVAELAPGGVLSSLSGTGHAVFEQTTAQGAHQTSSSDQLDVQFSPAAHASPGGTRPATTRLASKTPAANTEIASIHQAGHVILVQDAPPAKPGRAAQPPVRATASRADYDGQTQILHLWGAPRIQDGALDMTANQIDFARATGDAFAHGDVKASWLAATTSAGNKSSEQSSGVPGAIPGSSLLGGDSPGSNGPIHAVAAEAELHQATEEVVFRAASPAVKTQSANQPRIWQAANSVTAPLITLNRQKQTLVAEAAGPANPVRTVLVRNPAPKSDSSHTASGKAASGSEVSKTRRRSDAPSVIRVRSGDLRYSEGERLALFHGGAVGRVTVETTETGGDATVVAQQAEVKLLPAGIHSASVNARAASTSNVSVDQIIATGRVVVDWPDRQGTGERLVYRGDDGTFTLTGSGAAPPRITDQARGTVTGSALIFHSGDDSVTVEGDGGKTVTNTQAPKKHTK